MKELSKWTYLLFPRLIQAAILKIFHVYLAILPNSISKWAFNTGLTKNDKVMPNCQILTTFSKYSRFACLMGYFTGSFSSTIENSVPLWMCLVRVAETVLVWQISDLDSLNSVSLNCAELFPTVICRVLQCQWYLCNVYYLLVYLQASNLGDLSHCYEKIGAINQV